MMLFAARYKRYAAWPIVLWCRFVGHRNQPRWDFRRRCLRCGDPEDTRGWTTEGLMIAKLGWSPNDYVRNEETTTDLQRSKGDVHG